MLNRLCAPGAALLVVALAAAPMRMKAQGAAPLAPPAPLAPLPAPADSLATAVDATTGVPAALRDTTRDESADSLAGAAGDAAAVRRVEPPLFTRRELVIGAALTAVTIGLIPLDEQIVGELREPTKQDSHDWRRTMVAADLYGAGVAAYVGPGMALTGRLFGRPKLLDAGLHTAEAVALASAAGFVAKGLAGRGRPYWVPPDRATEFKLGRGFLHREPYSSFPSGHALTVYSFASAITAEVSHWAPKYTVPVASVLYGVAAIDAVSRVYRDTHWASDIAASAVIGTVSGLWVTRHQHANPDNWIDRAARRVLLVPTSQSGLALTGGFTF